MQLKQFISKKNDLNGLENLKDSNLIFCFFSPKLATNENYWQQVKSKIGNNHLVGCTGSGEVGKDLIHDESAVFTSVKFEKSNIDIQYETISSGNSFQAGVALAKKINPKSLKALYILSDGLQVNGTDLVKGLREILGSNVQISGGLAGDGTDFKTTFILKNCLPTSGNITGIAFYGDSLKVTSNAQGGWSPFGPKRKVTKSKNNVLFEIDGKPALKLYKEFLGEQAAKLPSSGLLFPIMLSDKASSGKEQRDAVRTLLAVNEQDQSMTFAGDIPNDSEIFLMRSGLDDLIQASQQSVNTGLLTLDPNRPTLSLVVSCVGRRLVLGEQTEEELTAILKELPKDSVQTGFYSYGELAPGKTGFCDLHNQTMTLTLIQE